MLLMLISAAWCTGVAIYLFNWSMPLSILFAAVLIIMAVYGLFRPAAWLPLLTAEIAVMVFYHALTPEDLFSGVKWRRECAQLPSVTYLPDGKIKISSIRSSVINI